MSDPMKTVRDALEFYADEVFAYSITQSSEPRSAVHGDRGARARKALAALDAMAQPGPAKNDVELDRLMVRFDGMRNRYGSGMMSVPDAGILSDVQDAMSALRTRINAIEALVDRMAYPLSELQAIVRGECPSLLNEDSGGDGDLDYEIDLCLTAHHNMKESCCG